MKQTVVRNKDKKECATILTSHKLTNVTTSEILKQLDKDVVENKPSPPEEVQKLRDL